MGQGFGLVDLTKKQYVSPHAWGRGYKLCEFAFSFDTFAVLYRLLHTDWATDRVAFVGEYVTDEEDDAKRGSAPSEAEIDAEYRVLETRDLRLIEGLKSLYGLGTAIARSAAGEQIDRSTLPRRVTFYNRSKRTFFTVDTEDVDEFTVAALVWFLVDTSSTDADDMVEASDASDRAREDDEVLELHGGTWAYDRVKAFDDTFRRTLEDERDATEDLRRVAAAFRRRNDSTHPDDSPPPPRKRQRFGQTVWKKAALHTTASAAKHPLLAKMIPYGKSPKRHS